MIEIINVIVIIGILAALALPRFMNLRDKAREARDQGVLAALRSAVYLYYVQTASTNASGPTYPPDIQALQGLVHWDPSTLINEYNWTLNTTP